MVCFNAGLNRDEFLGSGFFDFTDGVGGVEGVVGIKDSFVRGVDSIIVLTTAFLKIIKFSLKFSFEELVEKLAKFWVKFGRLDT